MIEVKSKKLLSSSFVVLNTCARAKLTELH